MWLLSRLLLVVVGSGYTLPALHLAAVSHEVCPEHGELEHVHSLERTVGEPSRNVAISAAPAVSHEHEPCGVVGVSPLPALVVASGIAVSVIAEPASATSLREAPAKANVAVLSYAPKLAPPV